MDRAGAYLAAGLPIAALERLARARAATEDPISNVKLLLAEAEAWAALDRHAASLGSLRAAAAIEAGAALPLELRRRLRGRLAQAYGRVGRFDQALESARAALELAGPEGDAGLRPRLNLILSGVHVARDEWLPAEAAARRAAQAFEALGDEAGLARALRNLGVVAARTDRLLAARRHLERAWEIDEAAAASRANAAVYELARDHTELAWVYLRLSDPGMAVRHGSLALEALWGCVGCLRKPELARVSHLFGSLYRAAGDDGRAVACLNRAAAYYAQSGRLTEWQLVAAELNEVLAAGALAGGPGAASPPPPPGSRGFPVPPRDRTRAHYLVTLLALSDSLGSVHPALEGRAEVVTGYALALGRTLGLPADEQAALGHAGRLHDIGLTLGEPGDARAERLHPAAGAELLRSFPLPPSCLAAVRHHHERWDGGGYPDGLRGPDIPLAARVLAVAGAYVARALRGQDADDAGDTGSPEHGPAMDELHAEAGRAFDPAVVAALEAAHAQAHAPAGSPNR